MDRLLRTFVLFFLLCTHVISALPATSHTVEQFVPLVRLSIILGSSDGVRIGSVLQQIADPASRSHGRHLSQSEALELLQPEEEVNVLIQQWLNNASIDVIDYRTLGDRVDITLKESDAKAVFSLDDSLTPSKRSLQTSMPNEVRKLTISAHLKSSNTDSYTDETSINTHCSRSPQHLSKRTRFSPSRYSRQSLDGNIVQDCSMISTPDCLRKLYNIEKTTTPPQAKSLLGIVGFNKQSAQHDQLQKFLDEFAPDASGRNFTTALVNGGANIQGDDQLTGEANLDTQYAVSMASNIPVKFYSVGGENHDFIPDLDLNDTQTEYIEPTLQLAQYLLSLPDKSLPSVISISYGVNEQLVRPAYARHACNLFGVLGTRGVSVVVSSGDTGPGVSCQSNGGNKSPRFLPIFPSSCPYVTSVGATKGWKPEIAAEFSSGGFSEYFDRPKWQDTRVKQYLSKLGTSWKGFYNPQGRAYPDVAIRGVGYQVFNHNELVSVQGTSASAPTFAAMIALLNDYRFKHNKPALGFLNPQLYSLGSQIFTDIKNGRSVGCEGYSYSGTPAPVIPGAGWNATSGWDAVTGLGTPDYQKWKALVLK